LIIAIQPDNFGPNDASSPLWTRLLQEAGHQVRQVDVHRADILEQLQGCHGFMWRHWHHPSSRQIAKRLLPVLERQVGLVMYPDQNTCWHYDDKIAQHYLLQAAGIPQPQTWVWFDREMATEWATNAHYPLVIKLWSGAGGSNVRMVQDQSAAIRWINRLFDAGIVSLDEAETTGFSRIRGLLRSLDVPTPWEIHRGYVLLQEFLPVNDFDTRITVIGDRAFGFRRFNRPNDFRASGSGRIDWDPAEIHEDFIRLAFTVARRLKTQSCAIDGLWRGKEAVVAEISYTYASWGVAACPGYWDSALRWHDGNLSPEEAQIQDYLHCLASSPHRQP
jgi:ribosomal protein S6-L-glutamate ligase RimK-like protein